MATSDIITLRLESGMKKRLDRLAKLNRRSRSFVAAEAIREYVELSESQIADIREGLKEAQRGEFASDEEVKRFFRKWRRQPL